MMRSWMGLIRAEVRKALSRRAVQLIGVVALVMLASNSWTNHQAGSDAHDDVVTFRAAMDDASKAPHMRSDPDLSPEESRESFGMLQFLRADKERSLRQILSPRYSHLITLRWWATGAGIIVAIFLASTLFGAEFRWRYWKTSAAQEPRRLRLVLGKLIAMWILVLFGLLFLLAGSYGVNSVFARIHGFDDPVAQADLGELGVRIGAVLPAAEGEGGWPDLDSVLLSLATAWLSTSLYATVSAAAVLWIRTSLAGPLASIAFLVADGWLLTPRFVFLRFASPAQQIAYLIPVIGRNTGGEGRTGAWLRPIDSAISLEPGSGGFIQLTGIPDWQAIAVLVAWIALMACVGIVALRSRDIPS